jgi:hypothetical protein
LGNPLCARALAIAALFPLATEFFEPLGIVHIDHIAHLDG